MVIGQPIPGRIVLSDYLSLLVSQSPRLLIAVGLIICAVFAVRLKPRLGPRASALGASGMGLLALSDLLGVGVVMMLQTIVRATDGYTVYSIINLFVMLIGVVGLGLIVAAVFVQRPGQAHLAAQAYPVTQTPAQAGQVAPKYPY
jgi:hypothetical protein